jgi:hypothetical protein
VPVIGRQPAADNFSDLDLAFPGEGRRGMVCARWLAALVCEAWFGATFIRVHQLVDMRLLTCSFISITM